MLWIPIFLTLILIIAAIQDYRNYEVNPYTWLPSVIILPFTLTQWSMENWFQIVCLICFSTCFIIPRARQYLGGADIVALILVSGLYPNPYYLTFLIITGLVFYGWSLVTKENRIPGLVPITLGFILCVGLSSLL